MGYHPRIETDEYADFLTTRTRNSELWFVNNRALEQAMLAYTAKYSTLHEVSLYALAIEGSHVQGPAQFTKKNRASFMRDLNSSIARAVPRHCSNYPGGRLWSRRYSQEFLPSPRDVEEYFFYTVLQPVQDGLVKKLSDYPGYNCFHDAVNGIARSFKMTRWSEYHEAKRWHKDIQIKDFTDTFVLKYKRLPGYEHMSKKAYSKLMHEKLEARRVEIVKKRLAEGKSFYGRDNLLKVPPGTKAKNPKTSERFSHRPRVLCSCPELREEALDWYFNTYYEYREASRAYRRNEKTVIFPPGTYKPQVPHLLLAA